jgi:hypothetical protein
MLLLSAPFEPGVVARARPPWGAYAAVLGAAAGLVAAGFGGQRLGVLPADIGHGLASGAVHGAWLALGWLLATGAAAGWGGPVTRLGATVIMASITARLGLLGPLAFLVVPLMLLLEVRGHPQFRAIGVGGAQPAHALAGLGVGAFLGAHLLVTASRTFDHGLQIAGPAAYLGALAYDVGANALSAEWLFRGAVFSRLWRRATFWLAAVSSTGLSLVRYLLDPALPASAEVRVGAIFYLGVIGLVACALRARSGSLVPGYLAALAFFAAYRMLAP